MKIQKQLTIIAAISILITMILFFALDRKANSGIFNTAFELVLMAAMIFIVIAINFFAIRFFVRKIARLFTRRKPG